MNKNKSKYLIYQNISGLISLICIVFLFIEYSSFILIPMLFSAFSFFHFLTKITDINTKEMKDKDNVELEKLTNFKASNKFQDEWGLLLAIDDINMKIAIKTEKIALTTYNYNDILECEIIEDDVSTYKKSTTRTVGGAILGGVLLGGAGAIVGGLSGKQKKDKKYRKIQLKLTLKDTSNPNLFLPFYESHNKEGIDIDDPTYGQYLKNSIKDINEWKDIIAIIIDKVDNDYNLNDTNNSMSDELLKLNELKEKGILTEEEFNEQKKKLLKQ